MAETLYLKQMECGPMQNYVYLIGDPATRQAAVVDPAWDIERIVQAAQQDGYTISKVLITHTHQDHIGGELFGHYARKSTSTIGEERQQNPYVQFTSLHAFLHAMGR